jgi:membrane fusion protein (multidrug efflux system)
MNKKQKRMAGNAIIIVLVLGAAFWILSLFIHLGGEYTDNASAKQHIVEVHSRTQGFIKEVKFSEFQFVKQGDTLLLIEDSEQRLQLAQANANYLNAMAAAQAMGVSIGAASNNVEVSKAGIREIEVLLANAESDLARYQNLLGSGAATRQQYDAAKTQYESLRAKLETMHKGQQSVLLQKEEQGKHFEQSRAAIEAARAALELARLNLSYTIVLAPCDGYALHKTIQAGELARHGQRLLSIVNSAEKWVIAYFREAQLKHIHVGSKAEVEFDALPDVKFEGEIASIAAATGEELSDGHHSRAVGNFIKVEQRIAVKILLNSATNHANIERIRAGMNAECIIKY